MSEPFDWRTWRRGMRRDLIAARRALPASERAARNTAIDEQLEMGFAPVAGHTVAFCWPVAAEPEPRFAVRRWRAGGSVAALPEVVGRGQSLAFRVWWPGVTMTPGVYDIPVPQDTERVTPAVALVPVNGFDGAGYRLGYGGGYFDRTLAALPQRPLCIGLGYEFARLPTIHPQMHDIPFDFIVTEAGIESRRQQRLVAIEAEQAAREVVRRLAGLTGAGHER